MKLNKFFMLGLAGLAFAACSNEEDVAAQKDTNVKSVTLSFENVQQAMTKAMEGAVANGTKAKLNDFQVFFADAAGTFYTPKNAAGTADMETFYNANLTEASAPMTQTYHFLDPQVSQVYVIGNYGAKQTPANVEALKALNLDILSTATPNEQDCDKLHMYGEDLSLEFWPTDEVGHTNSYIAKVELAPRVSRIEIVGYEYALEADATERKFDEIGITQILFNGYYPTANLATGAVSGTKTGFVYDTNQDALGLITKINEINTDNSWDAYYTDKFETAPLLNETGSWAYAYSGDRPAYNFFPTTENNTQEIAFTMTQKEGETALPYAMITNKLVTTTDVAKVYQVKLIFDDGDFYPLPICVKVEVTVKPWVVVTIDNVDYQ